MTQDKENKTLNQWIALNMILKTSKIIGITQAVAMIALTLLCLGMYFSDPIVVVMKDNHKIFAEGTRQGITIEKEDIKRFVEGYINARYNWDDFNEKEILQNVRPFVTVGFYKKLSHQLKKDDNRAIKGKKVRQVTADISIDVTEKAIVANFYKLLIIEQIPLPVFSQISVQLSKGSITKANHLGMYVNGIVKHESKSK